MPKRLAGCPSIKALAGELTFKKRQIDPGDFEEDETPGVDVRLQVHDGFWSLHTGDASYDQDHRGHWGAGFLTRGENCKSLAKSLIDEAYSSAIEQGEIEA